MNNSIVRKIGAEVKRSRRGGRRPQGSHGGHGGHGGGGGGGGGGHNPNRTFDSNGPEVKIRGTAAHVYEKYLQLARDANSSGDRVMAESYLQHAEHYFRIMAAQQAQQQQYQQQMQQQHQANGGGNGQMRPMNGTGEQPYQQQGASAPSFTLNESNSADDEEGEEAGAAE